MLAAVKILCFHVAGQKPRLDLNAQGMQLEPNRRYDSELEAWMDMSISKTSASIYICVCPSKFVEYSIQDICGVTLIHMLPVLLST